MATVYEKYEVKSEGLTLSLIVWRRFKRPMFGIVERILDEQGHLAKEVLDVGDVVNIPIDIPDGPSVKPAIQLWD